ncbi:MAG: hypothetical protein GX489_03565 [Firmicutes bacterium]|nr:hypothetical protein [Bacillota bacterium]
MKQITYAPSEQYYEGIISKIDDCSVTIDIKGRLGRLSLARRLIISDYELEVGQEVGFVLSYPEVLQESCAGRL